MHRFLHKPLLADTSSIKDINRRRGEILQLDLSKQQIRDKKTIKSIKKRESTKKLKSKKPWKQRIHEKEESNKQKSKRRISRNQENQEQMKKKRNPTEQTKKTHTNTNTIK